MFEMLRNFDIEEEQIKYTAPRFDFLDTERHVSKKSSGIKQLSTKHHALELLHVWIIAKVYIICLIIMIKTIRRVYNCMIWINI